MYRVFVTRKSKQYLKKMNEFLDSRLLLEQSVKCCNIMSVRTRKIKEEFDSQFPDVEIVGLWLRVRIP